MSDWQPMSRERFRELRRGDRLSDRRGREWSVTAAPYHQHGLEHVVIRSGDLVRMVNERWADDYQLLPTVGDGAGLPDRAELADHATQERSSEIRIRPRGAFGVGVDQSSDPLGGRATDPIRTVGLVAESHSRSLSREDLPA